jgi:hypothetical protein
VAVRGSPPGRRNGSPFMQSGAAEAVRGVQSSSSVTEGFDLGFRV